MRKRRMSKVKFDQSLILDTIGATLIVQKAPAIIGNLFPIPESVKALAGAGAGFLAGSVFKRPQLANVSIGLGVVDFISPMVDSLIGGSDTTVLVPAGSSGTTMIAPVKSGGALPVDADGVADYIRLNAYVKNPGVKMDYSGYRDSY